MTKYYLNVNTPPDGNHEVHKDGCTWMPGKVKAKYLGEFISCRAAVAKAKEYDPDANWCAFCFPDEFIGN